MAYNLSRTLLTAATTFYVNSVTGSDATSNGANPATPFKTATAAYDAIIEQYDCNGYRPTISLVGAGPYTLLAVDRPVGSHAVWVQGAGSGTTIMQGTAGTPALLQQDFSNIVLSGVTLQTDGTSGAYCWAIQQMCIADSGTDLVFGSALNGTHLSISQGARFNLVDGGYTIAGSALCHLNLNNAVFFSGGGTIQIPSAVTLGGPGSAAVIVEDGATFFGATGVFTGAGFAGCLGIKYILNNARMELAGSDPNTVFPGAYYGDVPTQSDMYMTATAANVTGDSTGYTLVFPTGNVNKYSKFNPSTGVFSSISSDEIEFNITITINGLTSSHTQLVLQLQNANTNVSTDLLNINPYALSVGGNLTISATATQSFRGPSVTGNNAGDTATIMLQVLGGTKTVSVTGTTVSPVNYTRVTAKSSALVNGGGSIT